MMPRILLTGCNGQVGSCLQGVLRTDAEVLALDREQLDITDRQNILEKMDAFRPQLIINAAAYTAVDRAESEPEVADAVNHHAVRHLAEAAARVNAVFLHISTDYVFSGAQAGAYRETDPIAPQSVYGRTKAAGEAAALSACSRTIILRTAWVFGERGGNFVKTMLRLGKERDNLSIVSDQVGAPTYAGDIAAALLTIARKISAGEPVEYGIYHFSGKPYVSWYEFAQYIFAEAERQGVLEKRPNLQAITTRDYPTPAKRPANSCLCLDKIKEAFGIEPSHWQQALKVLHNYL